MLKFLTILMMLCLVSCGTDSTVSAPQEISYLKTQGFLDTTLETVLEVTEYLTAEQTDQYLTAPGCWIDGDDLYVIRRFPDDTARNGGEAIREYRNTGSYREIEVYSLASPTDAPRVISLKGLADDCKVSFDMIMFDRETETLHLHGIDYSRTDSPVYYLFDFDADGNLLRETILPVSVWNTGFCSVYKGKFLYKVQNENSGIDEYLSEQYDLYCYDPGTGQERLIAEKITGYYIENGTLYFIRSEPDEHFHTERFLYAYDWDTSEVSRVRRLDMNETIATAAYDSGSQYWYYTDHSFVYAASSEQNASVTVLSADSLLDVMQISGKYLMIKHGYHQIIVYELPAKPDDIITRKTKLTFLTYAENDTGDANLHSAVFRTAAANGYNVYGQFYGLSDRDEYAYTLAKKLLAGDTDFDIFYVSTEMAELFEAQYYESLAQYPILSGYYDKMLPGLREICSIDGMPCLIPVDLYTNMMTVDTTLLSGEYVLPTTLAEFLTFKDSVGLAQNSYILTGNLPHIAFGSLFEQFVSNFMNKTVSDKQAQKDLLMLYETADALTKDGRLYIGTGGNLKNSAIKITQNIGKAGSLREGETVMPVLRITEDYQQGWSGGFYALNPNSPNKDLAAVFLACYMENDIYNGTGLAQLYEPSETAQEFVYGEGSGEIYALFMEQLASGVRNYEVADFGMYLYEQFKEIQSGALLPSDAAEETFRYLKMIRDE